jgi:hypothetical protein
MTIGNNFLKYAESLKVEIFEFASAALPLKVVGNFTKSEKP